MGHQDSGASRTFVVADRSNRVIGYYALAAGAVSRATATDPVTRAVGVSTDAGIRTLLVHALSERAVQFYRRYGLEASALHPMTLMLRLPSA